MFFNFLQVKWRCRGAEGRTYHHFLPSAIKFLANYVLHAMDSNVTMILGVIIIGLGHQRKASCQILGCVGQVPVVSLIIKRSVSLLISVIIC